MPVLVGGGEEVLWSREEESHDCCTADCGCERNGAAGGAAGVGIGVWCGFDGALAFWARA